MGLTGRGATIAVTFALGVLTGLAAAGWVIAPAGSSANRADWQPSPVPKDWDVPVLGRFGPTATVAPVTAATVAAPTTTAQTTAPTRPAGTATIVTAATSTLAPGAGATATVV